MYEDSAVPVKPSCWRYSVSAASTYCGGGVGTPVGPKSNAVPSPSGESAVSASAAVEFSIDVNPHRPTVTHRPTHTRRTSRPDITTPRTADVEPVGRGNRTRNGHSAEAGR